MILEVFIPYDELAAFDTEGTDIIEIRLWPLNYLFRVHGRANQTQCHLTVATDRPRSGPSCSAYHLTDMPLSNTSQSRQQVISLTSGHHGVNVIIRMLNHPLN